MTRFALGGQLEADHNERRASLRGAPVNWISWPAPAMTARDAPMRVARSSLMASNPAWCPPDTTSFGNVADASSAKGRSAS